MTEERKIEKPKVENLELNKETVQDLAEGEAEQAQGGLAMVLNPGAVSRTNCVAVRCTGTCS